MSQTTQHRAVPPPHPETEEEKRLRAQQEEDAARAEAESKTAHLPQPGEPRQAALTGADVAEEGEKLVKMNFPHAVTVTLPGYRSVYFPAGIQEVPASMVEHPYLADNGVTPV
jgi:hypothetical protein